MDLMIANKGKCYGTVQYSTVQYSTVRYGTVRYGTVRYGTVRYGTVQYEKVWAEIMQSTVFITCREVQRFRFFNLNDKMSWVRWFLIFQKTHKQATGLRKTAKIEM